MRGRVARVLAWSFVGAAALGAGCIESHSPIDEADADAASPRDAAHDLRGTTVQIQSGAGGAFVGATFEIEGVQATMTEAGSALVALPIASRTNVFAVEVTRGSVTATLPANAAPEVAAGFASDDTVRSTTFMLVRGADGACELWWASTSTWSGRSWAGHFGALDFSDCSPFEETR